MPRVLNGSDCVCVCPYLPTLHQVTQHHNHSTLPVTDHLPEISGSGLHGTLSYDEGSLLLVALCVVCVCVVCVCV